MLNASYTPETLSTGLDSIPPSALWAIAIAGMVGIAAAIFDHWHGPRWLPSMPAVGLAMVIPASLSITMFLGSLVAKALEHWQTTSLGTAFFDCGCIGTNRWREPDRRRARVARHTRLRWPITKLKEATPVG